MLRGRPAAARPALPPPEQAVPGTILEVGKAGLLVACGAGTAYLIEELQPEGKGVMTAYAFSLGTRIAPGDRFEGSRQGGTVPSEDSPYSSRRKLRGSTRLPSLKTS